MSDPKLLHLCGEPYLDLGALDDPEHFQMWYATYSRALGKMREKWPNERDSPDSLDIAQQHCVALHIAFEQGNVNAIGLLAAKLGMYQERLHNGIAELKANARS